MMMGSGCGLATDWANQIKRIAEMRIGDELNDKMIIIKSLATWFRLCGGKEHNLGFSVTSVTHCSLQLDRGRVGPRLKARKEIESTENHKRKYIFVLCVQCEVLQAAT
jgi:hypothetical protein